MSIQTVPSRDFTRDVSHAMRLAAEGPVFITDRGRPAFALLRIEDYDQLSGHQRQVSLLELMDTMPRTDGIDCEPPHVEIDLKVPKD